MMQDNVTLALDEVNTAAASLMAQAQEVMDAVATLHAVLTLEVVE